MFKVCLEGLQQTIAQVDNERIRYHVVYAVDANQRRGLQASLQSLVDNFDPKRRSNLHVHVLYQSKKLSEEDICLQFLSRTSVANSAPMDYCMKHRRNYGPQCDLLLVTK